jgi:hypothetical protein
VVGDKRRRTAAWSRRWPVSVMATQTSREVTGSSGYGCMRLPRLAGPAVATDRRAARRVDARPAASSTRWQHRAAARDGRSLNRASRMRRGASAVAVPARWTRPRDAAANAGSILRACRARSSGLMEAARGLGAQCGAGVSIRPWGASAAGCGLDGAVRRRPVHQGKRQGLREDRRPLQRARVLGASIMGGGIALHQPRVACPS